MAVSSTLKNSTKNSEGFRVEITNLDDAVFYVNGSADILSAARDAGVILPSACGTGNCTTCAARVLKGVVAQPEVNALSADQRDRGFVLLCVAAPIGDCQLLVGPEAQRGLGSER